MNSFWLKSRGSGTALDNARVFGVKRKSMGVVLAMALAVLLLPLNSANAIPLPPLTVTYLSTDSSGGTAPTNPNVTAGDVITVSANTGSLTRAGYTFTGWNDQTNFFYAFGASYTVPATNVTFAPAWVANPSKSVTYNANGGTGTPPTAQSGPIGSAVTVAANTFTRSGYTFTGWNTAANGSGTALAVSASYAIPAGDTIFYAQWSLDIYTITYNANGGTGSAASDTFTVLSPVRTDDGSGLTFIGKTFLGWRTTADGTGPSVQSLYSDLGDITLYAVWSGDYTVTYNNNGGSGSYAAETFTHPAVLNLYTNTGNEFTKPGFVFGGWTTLANQNVGPAITAYWTPANVTLYALWKYTVTYAANGGSVSVPTQANVASGSGFTVGANSSTRAGYSFVTWNNGTNGGNYAPSSTYPAASGPVTLSAVWAANFNTVTYNLNGGSGTAPTQANVPTDGSFTVAGSGGFSRTGYTFAGWNDGGGVVSGTYAVGSSNVTLTAQWTHDENAYSVTYNAGTGGSGSPFTETGTATSYNLRSNTFSKAGWAFTGWNTAANGSGTSYTENQNIDLLSSTTLNLYAQWSHNSYAWGIMYDPNGGTGSMFIDSGTSTSFTFAANPFTYPGRTFLGWGETESGPAQFQPGEVFDLTQTVGGGVFAIWSHNSYNYSFTYTPGTGSGTPYTETGTATSYTVHGNSPAFTKPGHSFAGWSPQTVGYVYDLVDTTTVTLTAQWTHNSYNWNATFVPNGGSGSAFSETATATTATFPTNPFTYPGRTFLGWGVESSGPAYYAQGFVYDLTENDGGTFYAIWSHNAYPYSFTYNPGTGSGTQYTETGTATTYTVHGNSPAFTKSGYTFTGWSPQTVGYMYDLVDTTTVTLTAQWSPNDYTITYDANGGFGSSDTQTYTTDGPAVTLHNDPGVSAPTNYYFVGWTTVQNDGETLITTYSTNANVTVYAFYSNQYSIAYDSNTATSADAPGYYEDDIYTIGSGQFLIVNEGNLFHKTNYTFIGWGTTAEAPLRYNQTPSSRVFQITPTANTTLYALWSHVTRFYQVTFEAGGGSGTMPIFTGNSDYITLPMNSFTREGYTFSHWSQSSPTVATYTNGQVDIDLTGTFVRTLTAVWTPNTYTITYNANGGTGSSDSQTYTSGNAATTLHNSPGVSRTGYTFAGWTRTANVGPAITTWGNTSGQFANVTVYALWTGDTYTITYNANGGTGSSDSQTYTSGGAATTLHNSPGVSRSGYTFAGWTTTANVGPAITTYGTSANVTVNALWTANTYTITYNANGGTGSSTSQTYTTGDTATVLHNSPGVSRTGYTFAGWTTTASDSNTAITSYSSLANVTVYALWTPNMYTIHYDTNTATSGSYADDTYTSGDTATVLNDGSDLVKTGYTFSGWTTSLNNSETEITTYSSPSNVTVYALWSPNMYTIHYDTNTATSGSYPDDSYTTGDEATQLNNGSALSKPGYIFSGWTTAANNWMTIVTEYSDLADITVYALWSVGTYVITYDANGGVGSSDSQTYTTGDTATALHNDPGVSRVGYTFGGWTTTPNNSGTSVTELAPVVNTTVYALWIPNTYTITYNANGGTGSSDSQTYTTGDAARTLHNSPGVSRTGYTFTGWTTTANVGPAITTYGTSANVMVYALWTLLTFNVTYDANGGTGSIPQTTRISGSPAVTLSPITGITRAGYNFGGWTLSPNNPATVITTYAGEANVTVYAFWVLQPPATNTGGNQVVSSFTVTFDGNGSNGGATAAQTSNAAAPLTLNGFTRTGFTFNGWNTVASGIGGTAYANGAVYNFGSNVTLFAQWTAVPVVVTTYAVSYNTAGGSAVASGTYTAGSTITLPGAPTRAGFTFNGWFVAATGGTALGATYAPAGTGDITIFAQWTAIPVITTFTVTFNGNDATGGSMAAQSGSAAAALTSNSFVRTGFTFAGWNTNAAGGGTAYANGAPYAFNANATLFAQWTANVITYTVSFDTQGGSEVSAIAYNAGSSVTLPSDPTRSGFTFDGWFVAEEGGAALSGTFTPSPAGNVTLYAQWTGVRAVVRFDSNGGSRVALRVTAVDAEINLPTPRRGGFRFVGWFTTDTRGGVRVSSPYTVTGNVTLYARWAAPKLVGFVLFPNDVLEIETNAQRRELNAIAREIIANKFTNVSLTGYFSNTGTIERNRVLAAGRANNAREYLEARLDRLGYNVEIRWTTNSSLEADFGSDAADRRVQIFGA